MSPDRWQRATRGLVLRVVLFLSVALLPVGVIAVVQTQQVVLQARLQSENSLAALTRQAAVSERLLIERAAGAARAMTLVVLREHLNTGRCTEAFRRFVTHNNEFSAAGFLPRDGLMTCSSGGDVIDFSGFPKFDEVMANPTLQVDVVLDAPISNAAVVVVSEPVYRGQEFLGYSFVSLLHDMLGGTDRPPDPENPAVIVTFAAEGDVLTRQMAGQVTEADLLPADRALASLTGQGSLRFTARTESGSQRIYAVTPIVPDTLYALGTWPYQPAGTGLFAMALPAPVFPLLMWIISLAVAFAAVNRLVIRHIRTIQSAMRAFARRRQLPEALAETDMPAEIAEIYTTFANTAETVLRDEAEMANTMHEKTVLLKEIHHRVKNNLQLISSMMNMQIRQLKSAEGRSALRRLQDRVLGLATIHRNLYQTENLSRVQTDELLEDLVHQVSVMGMSPSQGVEISRDFASVSLYPDQAVPLALLISEALTNALKHVGRPSEGAPAIHVSLRKGEDMELHLAVSNTTGAPLEAEAPPDGSGLGSSLMRAFASQLGGDLTVQEADGLYTLRSRFVARHFEPGAVAAA